jgi:hypothetical protein
MNGRISGALLLAALCVILVAEIASAVSSGGGRLNFSPSVVVDTVNYSFRAPQDTQPENLRMKQAKPALTWRFTILAGISKPTADFYGGFPAAKALITSQIATVNSRFNDPGDFHAVFQFEVDSVYEFSDSPLNHIIASHPGFDYRVTYDGYPTQGGGWYGPPWNAIHHSWPVSSFGGTFASYATDGIVHEFGHSRGAIDLYAIQVGAGNNPINGTAYSAATSIMNYPYDIRVWDYHSISLINRNADTVLYSSNYIDEAFPSSLSAVILDSTGQFPLQGAALKLYPVGWYTNALIATPSSTEMSGLFGQVVWPVNPFGPYGNGPWNIDHPNFLAEATWDGKKGYRWFPVTAPQEAFFANRDTAFQLSILVPTSCCRGLTGNIDCDPGDYVDISDLTALIDNLYISLAPLCCPAEANCDGEPGVDIADLTALIDFLYISFSQTASCQ